MENYFSKLNNINVNAKTDSRNGLTYLSWAEAWCEVKKLFPDATYRVYENADGWNYFTDGRTCWVKTGVSIMGIEHIEYLPVMDYRNQSIPLEKVTSFDVNKAIQRSITKAIGRHGLGLYIYAREDLPEEEQRQAEEREKEEAQRREEEAKKKKAEEEMPIDDFQLLQITTTAKSRDIAESTICKAYGKTEFGELTKKEWHNAITRLNKSPIVNKED